MNEDRIAGTARNMGGKVQEGFGRVTGDAKSQADGLINQPAGAPRDLHGQDKRDRLGCRPGGAKKSDVTTLPRPCRSPQLFLKRVAVKSGLCLDCRARNGFPAKPDLFAPTPVDSNCISGMAKRRLLMG
jgi:uncharacterized protein YjbJ (UPF0337 family)